MTMFGSQWLDEPSRGYDIDQSVRFNDDDAPYMHRTPSAAGNQKTNTISFWLKRTIIFVGSSSAMFSAASGDYGLTWYIDSGPTDGDSSVGRDWLSLSTGHASLWYSGLGYHRLRDPAAWYHFVFAMDTTQGTTADRMKVYINGDGPITATTSNLGSDTDYAFFDDVVNRIGSWTPASGVGRHVEGLMAEIHLIDGAQKAASDFGKYDSTTGQWVPIKYAGAYGDQGAYVTGGNSSALGEDFSGNDNDWATSGLAANDQLSDSPTSNYCVWNSIDTGSGTLTDGNLVLSGTTDRSGTFPMTSGKWAWKITAAADGAFGVVEGGLTGTESTYAATNGDVLEFQFDVDAGTLNVSVDGGSYGSVATGLTISRTDRSGPYLPLAKAACSADFGQLGFSLDDADFQYLNTANLSDPAIVDPSAYFQTTLYEGDGSTQSIDQDGNSTFSPNFVWIKNRDAADAHALFDTVRGATKVQSSNVQIAEVTNDDTLTAFESDGFALGDDVIVNTNAESYAAWQWNEGATPGFDIVSYTGNATARTISHSLGVDPEMIIVKNLADTDAWAVYHASTSASPATDILYLNSTAAVGGHNTIWNDTAPTGSVFTVGTHAMTNGNTEAMIAYLWSSVLGFSKFGAYEGNGNVNGTMVNVGFRPAFVMIKSVDSTSSWYMFDSKREGYNVDNDALVAEATTVEATADMVDLVSNGFKLRIATDPNVAETYVYMAFAESPFKYANAR